ncbi:MAG: DeoR/GlpR transcriptional regulator [Spirochaetota bacterium]|nr:DeoR/GlpR transcriptional regulator [Spirochaetota bacterium]
MFISERQKKIISLVRKKKLVKIKELCQVLEVTEPTMRNELQQLDQMKKLIQIRGGATILSDNKIDLPLVIRSQTMSKEKKYIAKQVIKDISDDSILFLDTSTTVLGIAEEMKNYPKKKLTVITTSFDIIQILLPCSHISMIFCGGSVDSTEKSCVGEHTIKALSQYHADIVLIGCHAISKTKGFLNGSLALSDIKKLMINNATTTWICADHSKFGRSGLVTFLEFDKKTHLYTDSITQEWEDFFINSKVNVHY